MSGRSAAASRSRRAECPSGTGGRYYPGGTVQSKVIDGTLADKMAFWGQIGHHGSDFIADDFLKEHKEYDWMRGLLDGHEMPAVEPV